MKSVMSKLTVICISLTIIGLMFASQSLAAIDLANCVGAWLFETTTGNRVLDSSGNENHGDIMGSPSLVPGRFGTAMDFGQDNYIVIPNSDSMALEHVTMAAWVYLRSYTEDARILTQEVDGDPYSTYSIMMSGGGYTKFEFRISLDNSRKRTPSIADVPLETWTHLAATYDGEKAVIYIDGEVEVEQAQSGTVLNNDNPLYIGASQYWTPRFVDGMLDEVALFSVALDQDQIRELTEVGISDVAAVSSQGKLVTTWAQIKNQ